MCIHCVPSAIESKSLSPIRHLRLLLLTTAYSLVHIPVHMLAFLETIQSVIHPLQNICLFPLLLPNIPQWRQAREYLPRIKSSLSWGYISAFVADSFQVLLQYNPDAMGSPLLDFIMARYSFTPLFLFPTCAKICIFSEPICWVCLFVCLFVCLLGNLFSILE